MAQQVTLGGDRIGSGNKQKVELHNYGMTSFNLEQDWKSSMAPGVLYPFMKLVGTNHGTFDIDLDTFVRTLPTQGPLFGSFKLQLDIYNVPMRLYQGLLHNNPVNLGMNMDKVYLPKLQVPAYDGNGASRVEGSNDFNWQISDNALLKYLGLSGIGRRASQQTDAVIKRKINAIPALAYYDIFKNYYANKQETNAYVITPGTIYPDEANLTTATYNGNDYDISTEDNAEAIYAESTTMPITIQGTNYKTTNVIIEMHIYGEGTNTVIIKDTIKNINIHCNEINGNGPEGTGIAFNNVNPDADPNVIIYLDDIARAYGIVGTIDCNENTYIIIYPKIQEQPTYTSDIHLEPFALANIDDMRNALLSANTINSEFKIGTGETEMGYWGADAGTDGTGLPYSALVKVDPTTYIPLNAFAMNGLCVKTYQSDLFNNWLDTTFIDGENGISAVSSVAVVNNAFTMDALNMAEKIYEYLNRVLVSGGTYEDWQEATYGEGAVRKAETPMYVGGMSAEVMFEEVINSSESDVAGNLQPLGSLGGKGTQVGKKGGTNIHIKCEEPSYIIGIASLTPRICYSQGNDWDLTELDTLDDLHKPALDGIGFQDLIVEQMCWWNTILQDGAVVHRSSAGKQTAWINYQTAVDKCFGDFANDKYSFMVLNRRYEIGSGGVDAVKDMTTYIDPTKYNYAFAVKNLAAQNFWVQIHSKVIARRKMGAQQIPNL